MTQKIQEILNGVLKSFENGNIPQAIAYSTFPLSDVPSASWSLLNRSLMFLAVTPDARGFRQWKHVNRSVRKGNKAFYILVPRFIQQNKDDPDEEEEVVLKGFLARPVFRVEDTEGEPLEYEKLKLPNLPLLSLAKKWGISVKAIPGSTKFYGYFSQAKSEIALASQEESVFYHELAHVAHSRILQNKAEKTKLRDMPEWHKEVVAELSAAVLCHLVGKTSKYMGNHYQYIRHYAKQANLPPIQACLRVMRDVEQVLGLILESEPVC